MQNFELWLNDRNKSLPLRETEFNDTLLDYKQATQDGGFVFIYGKLRYLLINFNVEGIEGRSTEFKVSMMNYFNKIAEDIN